MLMTPLPPCALILQIHTLNSYPYLLLQALRGGRDSDMLEEMQMAMGE